MTTPLANASRVAAVAEEYLRPSAVESCNATAGLFVIVTFCCHLFPYIPLQMSNQNREKCCLGMTLSEIIDVTVRPFDRKVSWTWTWLLSWSATM